MGTFFIAIISATILDTTHVTKWMYLYQLTSPGMPLNSKRLLTFLRCIGETIRSVKDFPATVGSVQKSTPRNGTLRNNSTVLEHGIAHMKLEFICISCATSCAPARYNKEIKDLSEQS